MKLALQQQLFASYPNFFRRPKTQRSVSGPLDYWGIECGDGWFSIIDNLASELEAEISRLGAVNRASWPRAAQIKEKFGTLRFYVDGRARLSPSILAAIDRAEKLSAETCERCGANGLTRNGALIHVACDKCEQERQEVIAAGTDNYSQESMNQMLVELRRILKARPV